MTRLHFDLPTVDRSAKGPEFDIGDEHFECVPRLPAGVMNKITRVVDFDGSGRLTAVPDVIDAIRSMLVRERWDPTAKNPEAEGEDGEPGAWVAADDVSRFDRLINDYRVNIDSAFIADVLNKLLETEEYGGRPTQRSRR